MAAVARHVARPLSVRPLTAAERQVLRDSLLSPDAFVLRRAQIVLASAAGERTGQIAPRVGLTMQGVRDVIHAFNARGLEVLRPGSHHPGVVSSALDTTGALTLRDLLNQSPRLFNTAPSVWTLKLAAEVADEQGVTATCVSEVTIRSTLAHLDVRGWRAKEWITNRDPEYARKQARRDRLIRLAQQYPEWLLRFADEVWRSRLAHRAWHAWQDDDHPWRLIEQTVAQDDPVTVQVTAENDPAVQVTAEDDPALQAAAVVALTVSTGGVDMDVQPTDVAGRAATFRLTYHNHSPAPVAIALLAHDSEERLRFRPEPAEPVVVPVDSAVSIVVHVVPKVRQLVGVPQAYGIVFRAQQLWTMPDGQAELVREARFTYVPYVRPPALARVPVWVRRVPVWTGALALVLLVLLLVLAGDRTLATATRTAGMRTPAQGRMRGLSAPSIRRFTLVHRRQGQPYALVWQTSDAPNVTLDGRPVSTHGAMVLPAPLHSASYRLVATNGVRRATAHLHVVVDAPTTDRHAFVLARPDIATFAVRRHGQRYAVWLVRHAVSVQLQGQPVASAGERLLLPGASTLRLVARNDVGSRQSLLPLAP